MNFSKYLQRFIDWLQTFVRIEDDLLVMKLVIHTASLGLDRSEFVEFAATKGVCGTFKLSGNSLPVFRYLVFDKSIMEFVAVMVEVSKPDRISFSAKIQSTDTNTNGKVLVVTEKYEEPFFALAQHLYRYFPYPLKGQQHVSTHFHKELPQQIQIQDASPQS